MLKQTVSQLYFSCMYYIVYSWIKYQPPQKPTQLQALPVTKAFSALIFNFLETEKTLLVLNLTVAFYFSSLLN